MVAQNMSHMCEDNRPFLIIIFKFEALIDVNNCLKQIELPNSLHACETYFALPFNISTMNYVVRIVKISLEYGKIYTG